LEHANRSKQDAAVSALLGLSQTQTSVTIPTCETTPPPHGLPTPDPSPNSKGSGPALLAVQHPNVGPLSPTADGIELAPPSLSCQISSPGAGTPAASTPAFHSPLSSPEPSPAPIITTPPHTIHIHDELSQRSPLSPTSQATDSVLSQPAPPRSHPAATPTTTQPHSTPTTGDSPPARLLRAARRATKSGLIRPATVLVPPPAPAITAESNFTPINDRSPPARQLRSRSAVTDSVMAHPDLTPAITGPPMQDHRSHANFVPPTPQRQLMPRKRGYSEYTSETLRFPEPYTFQLPNGWADSSPVTASFREQGFYKGLDVIQFANPDSHIAIHNQLSLCNRIAKVSEKLPHYSDYHTLLHQALVQSPYLYLTALAAMKTTSHRLISLPVPLIRLHGSQGSKLLDSTFPFDQYVNSEKEVPCVRLLYSLNNATLSLGTGLSAKEKVEAWWAASGRDLKIAAEQLQPGHFSTIHVQAGELIVMPPQVLWSMGADISSVGSSDVTPGECKFVEVRYISVTPNRELDFDYWPKAKGSFNNISRVNRDLLVPSVTGWGVELGNSRKRRRGAVEMRGIWGIGDALLGLNTWNSELVKLELDNLFNAPSGDWFNREFAAQIESKFNQKLASMVDTLQRVNERAFRSIAE